MRSLYVTLVLSASLGACARANWDTGGGDETERPDASVGRDGGIPGDDRNVTPVDAPSGNCTVMTRNLLVNPAFDITPAGSGWNATPIDPAYPLVTDQSGGVAAQSATIRAWMGGLERATATNKDVLFQDVAIPPMTTVLELKGYYDVRSTEFIGGVFDTAPIELATQPHTPLQLVQTLHNEHETTAWTPFAKTFTGDYSNMTVRVRLSSASDSTDPTSFFFDTLELDATFCQ